MPAIDFSGIDDVGEPIPEGKYRLRLTDVEESATQYGDEMWRLAHTVVEGKYEGRQVRDNLIFSAKAYPRAKLICSRLGVDTSGMVELTPAMLLDRAFVGTVVIKDYHDADGNERKVNGLAFDGYEPDPNGSKGEGGDVPY